MKGVRGQRRYKVWRHLPGKPWTWTDFADTQQEKRKDNICCCLFFCFRSRDCHSVTEMAPVPHAVQSKTRSTNFLIFWAALTTRKPLISGWGAVCTWSPSWSDFLPKTAVRLCFVLFGVNVFCTEGKKKKNSLYQDPIKPNLIPSSHSEELGPVSGHLKHVWECVAAQCQPVCWDQWECLLLMQKTRRWKRALLADFNREEWTLILNFS